MLFDAITPPYPCILSRQKCLNTSQLLVLYAKQWQLAINTTRCNPTLHEYSISCWLFFTRDNFYVREFIHCCFCWNENGRKKYYSVKLHLVKVTWSFALYMKEFWYSLKQNLFISSWHLLYHEQVTRRLLLALSMDVLYYRDTKIPFI